MSFMKNLILFFFFCTILFSTNTYAATFVIQNQCPYTVWAAASPGGGMPLGQGQSWTLNVAAGTAAARIWGRTGCNFDANGQGRCQTGDCGGLRCQGYGQAPNTLVEYALKQYADQDFYNLSLIEGFNIPIEFSPTSNGCTRSLRCTADINGQCPANLRAPGGCNGPCPVYNTDQYCCTNPGSTCGPTPLSMFFQDRCPDAYSYPKDDTRRQVVFTCPSGTNYRVVFCP